MAAPMLDSFLGYDPFAESRRVVRRAVEPEPQSRLAPGFSVLPGGNLMYSVADDPEKLYAQAGAEYDARVKNPRLGGLDNPDRLYKELFAPLDAVYRANVSTPNMNQIVEGPDGIYLANKQTGSVVKTHDYPEKAQPPTKYPVPTELNILQQPSAIKFLTAEQVRTLAPSLPPALRTNAAIESVLSGPAAPTTTTNSVAATQPKIYFGGVTSDPFSQQSTNAVPVVRTKSGKSYKVTVH